MIVMMAMWMTMCVSRLMVVAMSMPDVVIVIVVVMMSMWLMMMMMTVLIMMGCDVGCVDDADGIDEVEVGYEDDGDDT